VTTTCPRPVRLSVRADEKAVSAPAWNGSAPLPIGPECALGADNLQWVVLRARRHRGHVKWQPVAFVGSTRAVLTRILREKGDVLSPEGESALNALNPTFREWRALHPQTAR
jgi:hypothetical protein